MSDFTKEDLVTTYRVLRRAAMNPSNRPADVVVLLEAARGIAAAIVDLDHPV